MVRSTSPLLTNCGENIYARLTVMGSLIIEIKGNDRYKAIVLDGSEMQTYCDEEDLDFSKAEGLKAYIATGFNAATSEVQMLQVCDAPAGTGLLLVGQPGCYLAERATLDSVYDSDMLVGVLGDTKLVESIEDSYSNYDFHDNKFNVISKSAYIYRNEAYLRVPTQDANGIQTISPVFGGSTGINSLSTDCQSFNIFTVTGVLVKKNATSLRGLKKGVYIVKGQKVVVR